jgi:hypothetical protein
MSDAADQDLNTTLPAMPWPRAVAWLAVAAHISVAAALWRKPEPVYSQGDPHVAISLSLLLAQANLLTLWLFVGYGPVIRRIAWTVCGWSGFAFILATAASKIDLAFVFPSQLVVTAALVAMLRLSRRKIIWLATEPALCDEPRYRDSQFSILELFSAALGIGIAAALVTRIDLAATFRHPPLADSIQTFVAVSLPAAAMTLISILGLRGTAALSVQAILAGMALLLGLALQTDSHWEWDGVFEFHAAHWFVASATLWIYGMCGYRLVRTNDIGRTG